MTRLYTRFQHKKKLKIINWWMKLNFVHIFVGITALPLFIYAYFSQRERKGMENNCDKKCKEFRFIELVNIFLGFTIIQKLRGRDKWRKQKSYTLQYIFLTQIYFCILKTTANVSNWFLSITSPFKFVFSSCKLNKVICGQKAGLKCSY